MTSKLPTLSAILITFALFCETPSVQAAESVIGPKVEKDAHAEALLWEVWVSDDVSGQYPYTVTKHQLKVAVFDQRGAEMLSKVDIPHLGARRISDVWARTVKKNGETIELKKDGVFDRMIVKAGGLKVKATSFALPGIEPGAVVEYGWRERQDDKLANYVRLPLQLEYPVQTVRYHIKPLVHPMFPYSMRAQTFNIDRPPFEKEKDGFVAISFANIHALKEEPDMPPSAEISPWVLIYYAEEKNKTPEQYWHDYGKSEYERVKSEMKPNGDVKRKADELVSGASDDVERLRRLFMFCRSNIKNLTDPGAGISQEQRQAFKDNKSPADTLKQGIGMPGDVDFLFAALAGSVGFDARFARLSDRSEHFFRKEYVNAYFLRTWAIAVHVNDKWLFYDPAEPYVPFGMLPWREEGNFSLIADSKSPEMVMTEMSPPDKSVHQQGARFELSDDGTLEGDVHVTNTGHRLVDLRRYYIGLKQDERLASLQKDIEAQFPGAEVSRIEIDNVTSSELPLTWRYHIKIEGYARRTGKRLFLQPAVLQRGRPARFTETARQFPIYFHYPWTDIDHVTIKIPQGFELDNAEMPASIPMDKVGHFKISAAYNKTRRELTYQRELVFGQNLAVLFPVAAYQAVKTVFDMIHSADDHVITLKQEPVSQ
jgi:hypothetical protein